MTPHPASRFINPLLPRDRAGAHRVASRLEVFTDLCFVVAISQAASSFHQHLTRGHGATGQVGFAVVFFAICCAWLNFSWFAAAYDNDDDLRAAALRVAPDRGGRWGCGLAGACRDGDAGSELAAGVVRAGLLAFELASTR